MAAQSKAWVCDFGLESRWVHGCLSHESVVCCQVVSVTGLSFVWKSPTECIVSDCDLET